MHGSAGCWLLDRHRPSQMCLPSKVISKTKDAQCQALFLDDERGFASDEELMYCQYVCNKKEKYYLRVQLTAYIILGCASFLLYLLKKAQECLFYLINASASVINVD